LTPPPPSKTVLNPKKRNISNKFDIENYKNSRFFQPPPKIGPSTPTPKNKAQIISIEKKY
jgi:hypothetical protein